MTRTRARTPSGTPCGHWRRRAVALFAAALVYVSACGPEVKPTPTWMLGVFSSATPDGATSDSDLTQYHVSEAEDSESGETLRSVRVVEVNLGGAYDERTWTWRRRGQNSIAMVPSAGESTGDADIDEWTITKEGECGPHDLRAVHTSTGMEAHGPWYRGEVCVREADHCNPDCPLDDPTPYEFYWCDEPPEPCGEETSGGQ